MGNRRVRTCPTCCREHSARTVLCADCRKLFRARSDPGPTKPRRGHGFTIAGILQPKGDN